MKIEKLQEPIDILILFLSFFIQLGKMPFRIDDPFSIEIILAFGIIFFVVIQCGGIKLPRQIEGFGFWITAMFVIAIFVAPYTVGHQIKVLRIGFEAVSFLYMMIYMIVGYSLSGLQKENRILRWISYFCLLNASLSVISEITKYPPFMRMFYLSEAGIRFQGFSINPNDYMVQALVAFVYFFYSTRESKCFRFFGMVIIVFSAFAAGSKGGVFALGVFIISGVYKKIMRAINGNGYGRSMMIGLPVVIVILIEIIILMGEEIGNEILMLNMQGAERIAEMIKDPLHSFDANGSDRMITWGGAWKVFLQSPVIGVGIGNHREVLNYLDYEFAYETPHSIYLEMLEQSGVLGTAIVGFLVIKFLKDYKVESETDRILKGAFVILLLNGIFFAADWTLPFWIIVGIMLYRRGGKKILISFRNHMQQCVSNFGAVGGR